MVKEVHSRRQSGVTVLTLDRPVANALAPTLRRELWAAVTDAIADTETSAIVLTGAGKVFASGIDVTEYDQQLGDPWVGDLCSLIEDSEKPVVAALQGSAIGAGFELVLAAHARLAKVGSRVALPEVGLGLIPGAGGTQRLPRLVGAQTALEIMLRGQAVDVSQPKLKRVFDRLTDRDPLEEALELAKSLAESGRWKRTKECQYGFSDPDRYQQTIALMTQNLSPAANAELSIVKCVEAAQLLPFEAGLAFEQTIFQDRINLPESRGRRHCFASERRAAIMPELATGKITEVSQVAFLDTDEHDAELVVAFLNAGKKVRLANVVSDAEDLVAARVKATYDNAVSDNKLDAKMREDHLMRLSVSTGPDCLSDAQLILETRRKPAQDLPESAPNATWVMIDSDIDLANRARDAGVQRRAVGCRFFWPEGRSRLCELTVAPNGLPDPVATVYRVFSQMGMAIVRSTPVAGGAGDALIAALHSAALQLVEAGFSPFDVDEAVKRLGFPRGVFQMIDAEGLETARTRINQLLQSRGLETLAPDNLLNRLILRGATGRSARRGFYLYQEDGIYPSRGLGSDNPDMLKVMKAVGADHVVHAAIINEAARLLSDNIVQRASDLDVLMVKGYGFEIKRGGPLFHADSIGISSILKNLRLLQPFSTNTWAPHPLIESMVKNGDGFFGRVT